MILQIRNRKAAEKEPVQTPVRIHYNLESFETFVHEANTCLLATVNENRKTVVERATARYEIAVAMRKVTDHRNAEAFAMAAGKGNQTFAHRNAEASVD